MNLGCQLSSHSAGWHWNLRIRRTFNTRVRPLGSYLTDNTGGKGDLSDNWNAAAPSCQTSYQEALTIPLVSEMYCMVVICVFCARDSLCVAHRFWLHCYNPTKSWTLAILCNFLSSASFSKPSRFQFPQYPMLCNRLPVYHYWLKQPPWLRLFPEAPRYWFHTVSSR